MTSSTFSAAAEVPRFLYGTAWKEERTEPLVYEALKNGFKGIDTANQRKHYFEEAVGCGFQKFLKESGKTRSDFFLQTKFTFVDGQDQRLPYDPSHPIADQVAESFRSSLAHLGVTYMDSFVLHGPAGFPGINKNDLEAWLAMEDLALSSQVRFLGVSNVTLQQLEIFYSEAKIKPRFVQNRCYASRGWDSEVRKFCKENRIVYQGFSLLTANLQYLKTHLMIELAKKYNKTLPQITFRFAHQIGMLPLTGTTDSKHMTEDLNIFDFELSTDEVSKIERVAL